MRNREQGQINKRNKASTNHNTSINSQQNVRSLGSEDSDYVDKTKPYNLIPKPDIIDKALIGKESPEVKDLKMRRRMEYYHRRVKPDFRPAPLQDNRSFSPLLKDEEGRKILKENWINTFKPEPAFIR